MKNEISIRLLFLALSIITLTEATDVTNNKKIIIESKKKFSTNELLRFSIDTKGKKGFIYLVYVDKKGGTSVLYPEDTTVEKKKSGKLNFPKDFDNINLKTTKDCKGCEKEKTTIFVLLSDDPIEDIKSMNETELINIQKKDKSRGLSLTESTTTIFIDKLEFFVE